MRKGKTDWWGTPKSSVLPIPGVPISGATAVATTGAIGAEIETSAGFFIPSVDEVNLMRRGNKIECIKAIRNRLSMDMCKAKIMADALFLDDRYKVDASVSMVGPITSLTAHEKTLVVQGSVIPAIKEVCARTGLGLKEAKDVVDEYRNFVAQQNLQNAKYGTTSPVGALGEVCRMDTDVLPTDPDNQMAVLGAVCGAVYRSISENCGAAGMGGRRLRITMEVIK